MKRPTRFFEQDYHSFRHPLMALVYSQQLSRYGMIEGMKYVLEFCQ